MHFTVLFLSKKCWVRVKFALAEHWFKPQMKVIDHAKAVTQHFLVKSSVCFCTGQFVVVPLKLISIYIVYNIFSLKFSSIYIDTVSLIVILKNGGNVFKQFQAVYNYCNRNFKTTNAQLLMLSYLRKYHSYIKFLWVQNSLSLTLFRDAFMQTCYYWPIDSPPYCPDLYDLRIACLHTFYNMKAISLHYNITDQLSDYVMVIAICIGMTDKWIQ